ncbi:MAG: hypothetical protein E7612_09020 [Ruminococcaceae bacterium]|nr:hypothetical protein [Oscillospiraceae bacterium]
MNMFEEARALRGMIDMCSLTQSELAKKIGASQSYVANKLRLLGFSEKQEKAILDSNLSERHARLLLKIKDDSLRESAIEKIVKMNLSVAASEVLIDNMLLEKLAVPDEHFSDREQIKRVERLVEEAIKSLAACGIKATHSYYFTKENKYITICIEEKQNTKQNQNT